jgi:signal peptidase I
MWFDDAGPRTATLAPARDPVETWRPDATPPADPVMRAWRIHERQVDRRQRRLISVLANSLKIGLLLFVTYGLAFNFSVVRGSSMSPHIHDGDRILVDHLSYVFTNVQHGDIIVLQYPLDPSLDYIKRVIGLPGDDVLIEHGRVYVNGELLDEPYVAETDGRASVRQRVAPDTFFVLGDNRPHSSDSREFGLVPRENVVGKVDVRLWPPDRVGWID